MGNLRKSFDNTIAFNYKKKTADAWGGGCFITNPSGEYLIGLRTGESKEWCTPGGKVDLGESALEGVLREVKEESNINLEPGKTLLKDVHVGAFKNAKVWLSFIFEYKLSEKEYEEALENLTPQKGEIVEWKFLPMEDVAKLNLFPPTKTGFDILGKFIF